MDLQPLLSTLAKVSMGRVLPHVDLVVEKTLSIAKIPVTKHNTADKTDVALRRYAADWIRTNIENVNVQTTFEKVTRVSWYTDPVGEVPGQEYPLVGLLVLQWWPKPELTEHEQILALQRANRRDARKGES